jgi:hypothetical protein
LIYKKIPRSSGSGEDSSEAISLETTPESSETSSDQESS